MLQSMHRLTAAEQTAVHLREGIRSGRWEGRLPGVLALATECDVSPATMRAAIRLLEQEGWIRGEGVGRARTVGQPGDDAAGTRRSLRVMVLPGMRLRDEDAAFQQLLSLLQHDLEAAGHVCRFSAKSQEDLHFDLERIKKHATKNQADAWVVVGSTRKILSWFAEQNVPALAFGGSYRGLPMASTGMDTLPAYEAAIQRLIQLGHQRIVLLWPQARLASDESAHVTLLGQALATVGIEITQYHAPQWDGTTEGLFNLLDNAFRFTPPTAIIATYGNWMAGVLSFLAIRGLRAPQDISLVCLNEDTWFDWKTPKIACLRGDHTRIVRRIVRWVNAAARGRADRKYIGFPQHFFEGGTIGPAPKT